ncbi:MAG: hypothetical protein M1822_000078 [Bathelium mastoideum]|nr:MAG: hypothetical protein M1822_000078 [Bathelium mastoideum]
MDLLNSSSFLSRVEKLLDEWHVPGLAVAVVQNDTTTSKGFGKASLDPPRPCTSGTLFDIASSSKSLTAASVALLVADNEKYPRVQWDAKMSSLLPDDFVMSGEGYTENVTVEDVLSHRTGLPRHDSSYFGVRAAHPDTAQSVTRNVRNLQVSAPIRSKLIYCNLMYTVATYLVEKMSGLSFVDFLQSHFFSPLGMSSTYLQPDAVNDAGQGDRIATPYVWDEDNNTYKEVELQQSPEDQGAGSIITSVDDYIRYIKTMMKREPPISEEVYKGLIQPRIFDQVDVDELEPFTSWTAYAAGWWPRFYRGSLVVLHDGGIGGFGSVHFFLPKEQFGGVVLGNANGAQDLTLILAYELIDEALKVPKPERPDWNALFLEKQRKVEEEEKEEEGKLKKKFCPDFDGTPQPQKIPLSAYTGEYWNVGYRGMTLEIKDNKLFVDAADRSMGFYLTFEHVCDQTKYIAHLEDCIEGGDIPVLAEFRVQNDRIVKMGLKLEPDLDSLIWFDKADAHR